VKCLFNTVVISIETWGLNVDTLHSVLKKKKSFGIPLYILSMFILPFLSLQFYKVN